MTGWEPDERDAARGDSSGRDDELHVRAGAPAAQDGDRSIDPYGDVHSRQPRERQGGDRSADPPDEALALPDSTVRGWLQQLVDLEYLALVDAGQKGAAKLARYRLVDHAPGEARRVGLLAPEALRAQLR